MVRGWEPLGNLCASSTASQEATPYLALEKGETGHFQGTWGKHYFTINNLLLRSNAYWNQWSDNWASFDYVLFRGGWIYIPAYGTTQWLINFDPYVEQLPILGDKNANEDKWAHPGILLNTPGTHIILPPSIHQRSRFYKVRIKAPPGWSGYNRFPDAMNYILFHWLWSWFELNKAFINDYPAAQSACEQAPWWAGSNQWNQWVNRACYPQQCERDKAWGPFLPCRYGARAPEQSLFFFYRLKFSFTGNCIWRPLPTNYANEGLIPKPPGTCGGATIDSRSARKRKRPQDTEDILLGDLDSDGILTDRAYKRITGDHPRAKQLSLADWSRLGLLHDKLRGVLTKYNLLK